MGNECGRKLGRARELSNSEHVNGNIGGNGEEDEDEGESLFLFSKYTSKRTWVCISPRAHVHPPEIECQSSHSTWELHSHVHGYVSFHLPMYFSVCSVSECDTHQESYTAKYMVMYLHPYPCKSLFCKICATKMKTRSYTARYTGV